MASKSLVYHVDRSLKFEQVERVLGRARKIDGVRSALSEIDRFYLKGHHHSARRQGPAHGSGPGAGTSSVERGLL